MHISCDFQGRYDRGVAIEFKFASHTNYDVCTIIDLLKGILNQSAGEIEAVNNCSMVAEWLVTASISIFIAIISLGIFMGAILALR